MDPILLRVKSKSADRIPAYLKNCKQNVIVMLDALDRVDFETVTSLGHQMMGSGAMFGFQAITNIGGALQQAAESADSDASRKWVGELSNYLDGVETISSPSLNPENQSGLVATIEISNPDTDVGSKTNRGLFHKMDLPPE